MIIIPITEPSSRRLLGLLYMQLQPWLQIRIDPGVMVGSGSVFRKGSDSDPYFEKGSDLDQV